MDQDVRVLITMEMDQCVRLPFTDLVRRAIQFTAMAARDGDN